MTANTQALYESRQLDLIASRWDAKAATWDSALKDPACHLNEDNAYERFMARARTLVSERKAFCSARGLIDVGCGTGLVLSEFAVSFAWSKGVDISRQMIDAARAKNIPNAVFLVGDCFQLPKLCPPAGAILSRGILLSHYGLRCGELFLRAARATLAPEGFILFDFLNAAARRAESPANKTYFTRGEVKDMAAHAGFRSKTILGGAQRRSLLLLAE
jgi:SAM-dependent methyltransferase